MKTLKLLTDENKRKRKRKSILCGWTEKRKINKKGRKKWTYMKTENETGVMTDEKTEDNKQNKNGRVTYMT
jgi:hypothetical protein